MGARHEGNLSKYSAIEWEAHDCMMNEESGV